MQKVHIDNLHTNFRTIFSRLGRRRPLPEYMGLDERHLEMSDSYCRYRETIR